MELERRAFPLQDVEIRSRTDGTISFRGLAATYGDWSKNLGGFVERVEPSAFQRALAEGQDVPFLVNHDRNLFLGRTGTGTVKLSSTDRGLLVEAESLPDTQAARDLQALGGEIRSMSFGFRVPKGGDSWDWKQSPAQRSLVDVDLGDVSVLTGAVPAYNDTTAEVRALVEQHQEDRDYSTAERVTLAKNGEAIPVKNDAGEIIDGRYPIATTDDLAKAIKAYGRASDPAEVKAWIKKRAAALSATETLPDDWRALDDTTADDIADEAERISAFLSSFEARAGAVLSSASKQKVSNAMSAMQEAHGHLEQLMADAGDGPMVADSSDTFDIEMASLDRRVRLVSAGSRSRVDTKDEQAEREPAA